MDGSRRDHAFGGDLVDRTALQKFRIVGVVAGWIALGGLAGCAGPESVEEPGAATAGGSPRQEWAIVLHGGAGALPKELSEERVATMRASLDAALQLGVEILDGGGSSLDAVEQVIQLMEDDPVFNAGRGAVFNAQGENELDASIMDGRNLACGAVAGVRTVKNPIGLARDVMEQTRHVLLAGDGAEEFADQMGVERVDPKWFFTQERYDRMQQVLEQRAAESESDKGTVGVAALDRNGHLAAGTSTGGLTAKRFGRVGDSPIVGAGTYADDATCAISASGVGEEFIRHGVTRTISALMEYSDWSLERAAGHLIHDKLEPNVGGVIAVSAQGEIVYAFNTPSFLRAGADASGRRDVLIWNER